MLGSSIETLGVDVAFASGPQLFVESVSNLAVIALSQSEVTLDHSHHSPFDVHRNSPSTPQSIQVNMVDPPLVNIKRNECPKNQSGKPARLPSTAGEQGPFPICA
ncbi:hypothetical protein GDO86_004812 [Hymenochirus boettgeri]|uniref:Uncharacterized protein n=1 Tax=Hymenochirus boettgeri TaxID=247094 RepID=A0A8T2K7E5_9PIPI|nr:hypothetical protein GDO86_004812 [Hymenochirus boettgeri]